MNIGQIDQNQKVAKLWEINKLLTQTLDLEVILKTLINACYELIDLADTVILYMYDRKENALYVAEGVGINKEVMSNIRIKPGESLAGQTYAAKRPLLFSRQEEIKMQMKSMSEANYNLYFEGVYRREIRSAFCVPLIYQQECLGVIVVDNFENEGFFTEEDMKWIEIIADQSAIAIVNSRLFRKLEIKNKELSASLEMQKKFTKINLEGRGLHPVLTLLQHTLQCPVSYHEATELPGPKAHVFPIIRGKETLGYLFVKRPLSSLSALEMSALEAASTAIALELVKQNALYEKELHLREEIFQQMIEGLPQDELNNIASQLTWDVDWEVQCILIEGVSAPLWKSNTLLDKERLIKRVEKIVQTYCPQSLVFSRFHQIILIIPVLNNIITDQTIQAIQKACPMPDNQHMIFGVGRKTPLYNLVRSYQEAKEAIRFVKQHPTRLDKSGPVIRYTDLGVERLWLNLDRTTLEHFVHDQLGPIFSLGPEYKQTLITFIETDRNHKKTAQLLHIHPNTLYHRLKKIEQVARISLQSSVDWQNILVAYHIYVSLNKITL